MAGHIWPLAAAGWALNSFIYERAFYSRVLSGVAVGCGVIGSIASLL